MRYKSNKEFLTVQLLETQRMLELVENDPIMSVSLKLKEKDLLKQLGKIPAVKKSPKKRRVTAKGNHSKLPDISNFRPKRPITKNLRDNVGHASAL